LQYFRYGARPPQKRSPLGGEPGTTVAAVPPISVRIHLLRVLGRDLWRVFFLLATLLLAVGGPQHPRGTMAEMLGDPAWPRAHALMLGGFITLLLGLIAFRRNLRLPWRSQMWLRFAIAGTFLQVVEMAFHAAAAVDHAHLVAGAPTPILTTHLWLTAVAYPVFGLTIVGLIIAGARDRVLGSTWIAWIGGVGAVAHGVAPPLIIVGKIPGAAILFLFLMLLAPWLALAAVWPRGMPRS
jgi:hypothetical protein